MNQNKFAILSHVLPPSDSGQAVMLYRLLEPLNNNDYILISENDAKGFKKSSRKLPAKYFYLKKPEKFGLITRLFLDFPLTNQLANYLYPLRYRAKILKEIIEENQCQTLVVCSGSLSDFIIGYLALRKSEIKLIIYSFDDFVYQWVGLARIFAKIFAPLVFKRADVLIVPNEFLQKEYFCRYHKESKIVRNPFVGFSLKPKKRLLSSDFFHILYTGSVYHAHYDAFVNLIRAVKKLCLPIKIDIMTGQNPRELKKIGIGGENVDFYPNIRQEEVVNWQKQADILFLPLAFKTTIPEVIRTSAPGKIGEYLYSETPILVHAPLDSFLSWYFKKNLCGEVVSELDSNKLAFAISRLLIDKNLLQKYKKNAKKFSEDFSLKKAQKNFNKIVKK
jgi:hypothetical protein